MLVASGDANLVALMPNGAIFLKKILRVALATDIHLNELPAFAVLGTPAFNRDLTNNWLRDTYRFHEMQAIPFAAFADIPDQATKNRWIELIGGADQTARMDEQHLILGRDILPEDNFNAVTESRNGPPQNGQYGDIPNAVHFSRNPAS